MHNRKSFLTFSVSRLQISWCHFKGFALFFSWSTHLNEKAPGFSTREKKPDKMVHVHERSLLNGMGGNGSLNWLECCGWCWEDNKVIMGQLRICIALREWVRRNQRLRKGSSRRRKGQEGCNDLLQSPSRQLISLWLAAIWNREGTFSLGCLSTYPRSDSYILILTLYLFLYCLFFHLSVSRRSNYMQI